VKASSNVPGISDHDMVVIDTEIKPTYIKKKPRKIYKYNKADWETIKKDCLELSEEIQTMTHTGPHKIEDLWTLFKNRIHSSVEKNVPSKTQRHINKLPWLNHNLKKNLKKKGRLYKQAKKTGLWTKFKQFQKECKRDMRRAELDHVNRIIT
jgi:hypothetical protein